MARKPTGASLATASVPRKSRSPSARTVPPSTVTYLVSMMPATVSTMPAKLPVTGDEAADRLLEDDPLALLIGMLLDQQVPMEWAFHAPYDLKGRLGGRLDAGELAGLEPD